MASKIYPADKVIYFGYNNDDGIRIKKNGKRYTVKGLVFELRSQNSSEKLKRQLIHMTSDFRSSNADQSFKAICPKTKKSYRVIGQATMVTESPEKVKLVAEKNQSAAQSNLAVDVSLTSTSLTVQKNSEPLGEANPEQPMGQNKKAKAEASIQAELKQIKSQIDLGFDPLITIKAMVCLARRSKPTLYRDFGRKLPKPTKIGRNSFLRYSEVYAYMEGRAFKAQQLTA